MHCSYKFHIAVYAVRFIDIWPLNMEPIVWCINVQIQRWFYCDSLFCYKFNCQTSISSSVVLSFHCVVLSFCHVSAAAFRFDETIDCKKYVSSRIVGNAMDTWQQISIAEKSLNLVVLSAESSPKLHTGLAVLQQLICKTNRATAECAGPN